MRKQDFWRLNRLKYSEEIMRKVRYNLGLEDDEDTSKDTTIEEMSGEEVFDRVLKYEGIIGYSNKILDWVQEIFGVEYTKQLEVLIDNHENPYFSMLVTDAEVNRYLDLLKEYADGNSFGHIVERDSERRTARFYLTPANIYIFRSKMVTRHIAIASYHKDYFGGI